MKKICDNDETNPKSNENEVKKKSHSTRTGLEPAIFATGKQRLTC